MQFLRNCHSHRFYEIFGYELVIFLNHLRKSLSLIAHAAPFILLACELLYLRSSRLNKRPHKSLNNS